MNNPTFQKDVAEKMARERGCQDKVMWVAFRSSTSQYGEYDDTAGLITPDGYTEFKFNTLPSKWEPRIAKLMPGDYKYIQGLHGVHHFNDLSAAEHEVVQEWLLTHIGEDYTFDGKILPYWAFRQHSPVTVQRDGVAVTETITDPANWPWIDLHSGGWNGTSSLGCQTWHPEGWQIARKLAYTAMGQYGQKEITYSLHQL